MFGRILIFIITLMHVYVFWRAASVPLIDRHVPRRFLIGSGIVLWTVFFLGRVFGHGSTGPLTAVIEFFGMNWMAVLFLLCISLLSLDLATGFGFLFQRQVASVRGWALVVGGVLSVIAVFQGMRTPVIQSYEVSLSGLPDEMEGKILVAMSDLHIGSLLGKRWLAARVAQVEVQQPDLVVLLGDIFEGHGQPSNELISVIGRLSAPLGVWAVAGNHEFHGNRNGNITSIKQAGIRLLRNRWAEVRPGFVLAGVEDLTSYRRIGLNGNPTMQALSGRPSGTTVLLSHTPWQTEMAANSGVKLMLSGHTHGGQIWPFSYLVRLRYPLVGGRYVTDGMTIIVCRGTGTWGPRMRLWGPGEILRVTLRSEK